MNRRKLKTKKKFIKVNYKKVLILFFVILFLLLGVNYARFFRLIREVQLTNVINQEVRSELLLDDEIETFLLAVESKNLDGDVINSLYLFVGNTETSETLAFYIPGWVYVPVDGSEIVAAAEFADLRYLAQLEGKDAGYNYVFNRIEDAFAFSIDNYTWILSDAGLDRVITDDPFNFLDNLLDTFSYSNLLFGSQTEVSSILNNTYSNYSATEISPKLRAVQAQLNEDHFYDLGSLENALIEDTSQGDSRFFINLNFVDSVIADNAEIFTPQNVKEEQATVEVFNASDKSGLASQKSRFISNKGIKVLRAGNAQGEFEKSVIYVAKPEEYALSVEYISELLEIDNVKTGRPSFLNSGDIVIIVND